MKIYGYEVYCKLRDEKKVTDNHVAVNTGISRSTFTDWKTGRSKPGVEKLAKIAKFFGVRIEDFVSE